MVVEIGTTSGCEKRDYDKLDSDMLLSRGTYYSDGWMTRPRAHFLTTEPHKTDPRHCQNTTTGTRVVKDLSDSPAVACLIQFGTMVPFQVLAHVDA